MRIGRVRVFDGERMRDAQDVVVRDGVIASVRDATPEPADIDGAGRTLLPGLFDAHVHVSPEPDEPLRQLATMGVTTALDMFCGGRSLQRIRELRTAEPAGLASVRTAGTGATGPGSMLERMGGEPLPAVDRPQAAPSWVDARLDEGSDYIKIVYDPREGGPLDRATLAALVRAAHDRGVLAVAHTLGERQAREAIAAGVDGLVHLFIGELTGAGFGAFAAAHGVFVIPTLAILRGLCGYRLGEELADDPWLAARVLAARPRTAVRPAEPGRNRLYAATVEALNQLVTEGVPILAGTDTAPITAPFGVYGFGATLHAELELLVRAGLPPVPALAAATSAPAGAFGLTDRGGIRPGLRADLLLVEGDPRTDIRNTRKVVAVWQRGVPLDLSPPPESPAGDRGL
ncbi:amidohydrolase family protein [Actinoplanes subtropicus]|uniref:amidohydrolase family protein n=1 Tax=Actinoplanes subtropicus TaxID=543632 RepID=UPI000690D83C|nr:amidohydrolase family protein [Actinoplanes subtropicus]